MPIGWQGLSMSPRKALTVSEKRVPTLVVTPEERPCLPGHAHFWMLATPNGPETPGICKHCFAQRTWPTSFKELGEWKDRTSPRTRGVRMPDYA